LQEWVKQEGLKVVVLFEGATPRARGRHQGDHRAPQPPGLPGHRPARPSDRERTQWYFQRYVAHLPAAGEMVLFDRSGTTGPGSNG
jgi:polyphosphate kinase 2 (PPK2 family)